MENLCVICGIRKSTEAQLDKHIIEYHDGRSFSCDVCQKQCFGRKGLQNHMKTHQLINCNICSQEFKSGSFYQHKKNCGVEPSNVEEKPELNCNKCDYVIKFQHNLKRHLLTCQKEKLKKVVNYACSVCEKLFKTNRIHDERHGYKILNKLRN